jgi:dienelactone hydrolase
MALPHARTLSLIALCIFLITLTCGAQQPLATRIADVTSGDGVDLKVTYFGAGKPGPGVILLHQCNRQRKVWDDLAGRLAKSGLNVLTLDFRGFGDSGGTRFEKLSADEVTKMQAEKWSGDVDAALRFLVSQPGVNPNMIGAGGASCGVNQSVQLARRHPEVKSLVLLSEGTDRDGRRFLRNSPDLPLFLAVADDDPDDGVVEIMEWLYSLSSDPFDKFVHYSVGGHGVEMFAAHKDLPGMIVDWFAETLTTHASAVAPAVRSSERTSAESRLLDLIDQPGGGGKQAAQMYAQARERDPNVFLFSEIVLDRIGDEHVRDGDKEGGIEILKLNVSAYPNAPLAHAILSNAYLANGQKDLARESARKALELLPSDTKDTTAMRDAIKAGCEEELEKLGDSQ